MSNHPIMKAKKPFEIGYARAARPATAGEYVYHWFSIRDELDNPRQILESYCKLIQVLHEKGVLSDEQVRELVR